MNQRINLQQALPLLFATLLVTVGISFLLLNNPPALRLAAGVGGSQAAAAVAETFDYEQAAENSAYRWQAMAGYYEAQGLLTRDTFNYEQAAENSAYRWQAMADYYETQGLLTRDTFDYEQAAENSAFRWQAMARAYERMGLLNDQDD